MSIEFEFLEHGDCTVITTSEFTMMVDGGYKNPFSPLIYRGKKPVIDSVLVTHIDRDHIGGVIDFLSLKANLSTVKNIVFNEPKNSSLFSLPNNSTRISMSDGNSLTDIIKSNQIDHFNDICTDHGTLDKSITGQANFRILSPSRIQLEKLYDKWVPGRYEKHATTNISRKSADKRSLKEMGDQDYANDRSIPNGSSLAFLIEYKSYSFLILGDAYIDQITMQLKALGYKNEDGKRLKIDFAKLSHHGSKKSISIEFLSLIETDTFVISKPSQPSTAKPDRDTIAMIAKHAKPEITSKKIFVNDPQTQNFNFTQEERDTYSFEIYPTRINSFRYP